MARIYLPVAAACISAVVFLGTIPAQTANQTNETTLPHEISQVRIVRLSEVKGAVQLDRNTGVGYEPVMTNLPIVEHSRLQTGNGVAEVEFEDNSTLRLAPNSIAEFPQLGRIPGGTTVTSVRVVSGTAYVSLLKSKESRGNEFDLLFGQQKVQLPPSSHIRLQVEGGQATLAILNGTVPLDQSASASGSADLSRNRTATFDLLGQAQPTIAKDVVPGPYDSWDKNSAETHSQSAAATAFGSPYSYGVADMMYYGSFMDAGGCGSMWRPYFASAAWDPYDNGVWAWYQGAGYSWVSPYPWGWTPFHFGSWAFCPGSGWGWRPGGSWNGLNNLTSLVTGGGGTNSLGSHPLPPRPMRPPQPGASTLTVVNTKPLVRSEVSANSFVFRKDSAGLGIPRQGLGNLNKFSQGAITRGIATTPVYVEGRSSENGSFRPGENRSGENLASGSIHRGSAPSPETQRSPQSGSYNGRSAGGEYGGGGGSVRSAPVPSSQPSRSFSPPPSSSPAPSAAPAAGGAHH